MEMDGWMDGWMDFGSFSPSSTMLSNLRTQNAGISTRKQQQQQQQQQLESLSRGNKKSIYGTCSSRQRSQPFQP
jgi:hypothetical protein